MLLGAGHPRLGRVVPLSCSTLVLPLLFWESCQPLGCGSWQAPVATTRTDWTDLQPAMAEQPFISQPSKRLFSTNTYQRALGGLGCLQAVSWFAVFSSKS